MRKILSLIIVFIILLSLDVCAKPLKMIYLLDNSGSMYPEYNQSARFRKGDYYYQNPEFQKLLSNVIKTTTAIAKEKTGKNPLVSVMSFNTNATKVIDFQNYNKINADKVAEKIPSTSRNTHTFNSLKTALSSLKNETAGIIWLLTDNRPDTGKPSDREEVRKFYDNLRSLSPENPENPNDPLNSKPHVEIMVCYPHEFPISKGKIAVYGIVYTDKMLDKISFPKYMNAVDDEKIWKCFKNENCGKTMPPILMQPLTRNTISVDVEIQVPPKAKIKPGKNISKDIQGTVIVKNNFYHEKIKEGKISFPPYRGNLDKKGRLIGIDMKENGRVKANTSLKPVIFNIRNINIKNLEAGQTARYPIYLSVNNPIQINLSLSNILKYGLKKKLDMGGEIKAEVSGVKLEIDPKSCLNTFGLTDIKKAFRIKGTEKLTVSTRPTLFSFEVINGAQGALILTVGLLLIVALIIGLYLLLLSKKEYDLIVDGDKAQIKLSAFDSYPINIGNETIGSVKRVFILPNVIFHSGFGCRIVGGKNPWIVEDQESVEHEIEVNPKGKRRVKTEVSRNEGSEETGEADADDASVEIY